MPLSICLALDNDGQSMPGGGGFTRTAAGQALSVHGRSSGRLLATELAMVCGRRHAGTNGRSVMPNVTGPDVYAGLTAVDQQGSKIGSVGQVYLNDQTGQPDWVTVNTGLFAMRESFAPLAGSSVDGDRLVLPFDKAVVKDAPDIAESEHLDLDERDGLYAYYGRYVTGLRSGTVGNGDGTNDTDPGGGERRDAMRGEGYDTSGPTTDEAMTRSEEQLRVGTEQVQAGRARLRKYVVTEQQSVQVPVTREEVRVEREPITDANRGAALSGPDITEEEHEVVLHEERPVVQTEAVPVERVRLGTETVTDEQTVTGQVRKEQVEVDDPTGTTGAGGNRSRR
jgi:uncharacterized protein (TIGR02271 family)